MNTYDRLFGAGPRGLLISAVLLILAWRLESIVGLPRITDSDTLRWTVFGLSVLGAAALAAWSFKSLGPADRGVRLVTTGAYRYFRHPVYATLLSSFDFGLAILLNNWVYLIWALALHAVWHWNIRREEELMLQAFPEQYPAYCRSTGRFIPRLWRLGCGPS
jgi:protein-S-isoprenylcysteine O-methyltransferase Ste14